MDSDDPTWQGASWYGPTSGEYWTVNPREYADPRKHGPDYQSRASERATRAETRQAERTAARGPTVDGDGAPHADRPADRPGAGAWKRREPRPRDSSPGAGPEPVSWSAPEPGPGDLGVRQAATALSERVERSPYRRLIMALLAWPPLGVAAGSLIGEVTGCAAFSATCTSLAFTYPWFAQLAILVVLMLAPGVTRLLVGGTIAVAVLAFPVAASLVAGGASYDPVYGPASLFSVLAVAWLGGVLLTFARGLAMRRAH
ncbi:MAG: hypothetical protein ABIQ17_04045 [Candidatus Limnocylindrales bacterium]